MWLFHFSPSQTEAQFSLKPRPSPACKTYLAAEIGYLYRITSFPEDLYFYNHRSYFTSDVGIMINLSPTYALGAANFVGMDNDGQVRWGAKARARRWFGPERSVDLSLGLNFYDSRGHYKMPGFSSALSLSLHDLFIFQVLVEVTPYQIRQWQWADSLPFELLPIKKGTDVAIYTGIKAGRKPGLIANIAAAIVGAVFLGLYIFGEGD
jgi:hypothetical protein